jgi:PKD repeat protein
MRDLTAGRVAHIAGGLLALIVTGCSTAFNPLPDAPDVRIVESARVALTAGALPATGIQLTDGTTGAAVSIPGGTVITLDASAADDIAAVRPTTLVVSIRPISQFLANQNGDFLNGEGQLAFTKVGAMAVTPVIGRASQEFTITIPIKAGTAGPLLVWRFVPDDNENVDGTLTALPTVGHWRVHTEDVAPTGNTVVFTSTEFGQFIVTTGADVAPPPDNAAPVAALSADPLSGNAPFTVNFNAGGSTDSDGTLVSYEWDFDGDAVVDDTTTAATTTHEYTAEDDGQSYAATVTVTDDDGASDTATVTILVGEQAPVIADLRPPTATLGVETTFTLTATDADGTIANVAWDFDDDPDFEVDGGTALTIAHTFDTAGPATVGVQVTDDATPTPNVVTREFTITVVEGGAPGPVELTALPNPATLPETGPISVQFNTAVTLDPAPEDTRVEYNFGETGSTFVEATDADPLAESNDYEEAGTYTVTVRVTPINGGVDGTPVEDTVTLVVNPFDAGGGAGPSATLTPSAASGELDGDGEFEVDFTTTIDPDDFDLTGATVEYQFAAAAAFEVEDDGTPLTATHTYTTPGEHVVTVRITPADPVADPPFTASTTVTVTGNLPPVARILSGEGDTPLEYSFNGSTSSDPDGNIATYGWSFGDGSGLAFGESVEHTFPGPGTYTVILTVADDGTPTRSDTDSVTITIAP